MDLIYLEWEDAIQMITSDGHVWFSKQEIEDWANKNDHIVCETGYLFKETKKYIVLISRVVKETEEWQETYGVVQKIPKTWIHKRINLTKHAE